MRAISIPLGSIKSIVVFILIRDFLRISIPLGSIKSQKRLPNQTTIQSISIPLGSIKRSQPARHLLRHEDFNSIRFD